MLLFFVVFFSVAVYGFLWFYKGMTHGPPRLLLCAMPPRQRGKPRRRPRAVRSARTLRTTRLLLSRAPAVCVAVLLVVFVCVLVCEHPSDVCACFLVCVSV